MSSYVVGYIYGGLISELIPFKTFEDAESYIKEKLSGEKYNTDDWEENNNIRVKHYYIPYDTYFIADLRKTL